MIVLAAGYPGLPSIRLPPIIGPLNVILNPPEVTKAPLIVSCPDNNKMAIARFISRCRDAMTYYLFQYLF